MTYARRAIAGDMEAVVALAAAFHAESPLHSTHPFNEAKVRALIGAALPDPAWLPVVACDDEGLCGIALVYAMPMFFSEDLQAGDLAFYVTPNRRGGRAAIAMLNHIEEWAQAKSVAVIEFGINTGIRHLQSRSFFAKSGYREVGLIVRK